MASNYLCLSLANNTQTEVNTIAECIALDPAAYIAMNAQTLALQPTLQDIFSMPVASDLQNMWELGFSLPILCYLVAWGYGSVINFIESRQPH
jgi:hypothetical protein